MKKIIILLGASFLLLAGCNNMTSENFQPPSKEPETQVQTQTVTQVVTQEAPSTALKINTYIYPDRNAKIGQKYGKMTLEKIDTPDEGNFAHFAGKATVSGYYEYHDVNDPLLTDEVCFFLDDSAEIQKIPQSESLLGGLSQKSFCFDNSEKAKQLLGTGKGEATITIDHLNDNIDSEGEAMSTATLTEVVSKSEGKK